MAKTAIQIAADVVAAEAAEAQAKAAKDAAKLELVNAAVRINAVGALVIEATGGPGRFSRIVLDTSEAEALRDQLVEWFPV